MRSPADTRIHTQRLSQVALRTASLGAVYTPAMLAAWAADILVAMLGTKRTGVVLDPACGDGALLAAVASRGQRNLVGVDCDTTALAGAAKRVKGGHFHRADGMVFLADVASGGRQLAIDGVIANPPWGADIRLDRASLAAHGYRTISGQTDSWDLFVDGILRAAKPNAAIVLILPDAIFLPEHRPIREILAKQSRIELIARLGEGFFPGVYRGTVVVALRNSKPTPESVVSCIRLPPTQRRLVLAGSETLADATRALVHHVPQVRYSNDPECQFDIDARESEHATLSIIDGGSFPWDRWLDGGRGIEVSKTGRVATCSKCGDSRPLPRNNAVSSCLSCGHALDTSAASAPSIVRDRDEGGGRAWHPFLVGEDVDRHTCAPSRLIRMGVPGIRYKPLDMFAPPKLLVRKTGVGIKAAVDESGAATNQVVFHFTRKSGSPECLLDYLEGVLCSRVLLAWHLKHQGDSEWRSHPYITQRVIRRFPIPVPASSTEWAQARAIADAVKQRRLVQEHNSDEDFAVERLVAGMFRLTTRDMTWVLGVLDAAQQLEPIRTLRVPSVTLISPRHVSRGAA